MHAINPEISVLHGAGIHDAKDVDGHDLLGAEATIAPAA